MVYLTDHPEDLLYQSSKSELYAAWQFRDPESGIATYGMRILEYSAGQSHRFWPKNATFQEFDPSEGDEMETVVETTLRNGLMYIVEVVASNKAGFGSTQKSKGVIIDSTPPTMINVSFITCRFVRINTYNILSLFR